MIIRVPITIKLLALVLAAGGLVFFSQGCSLDSRADSLTEPYLHRVETSEIRFEPGYDVLREFAGEVQAGQSSELGFEFPGQLLELYVDEGESVVAGQLLARMDTGLLQAERDQLTAQKAELQAELETAQRNLERVEKLQSEQLASERELDELKGRTRVLQASLQRADAGVEANGIRMAKSELRAPFSASIVQRFLDSGVVVSAGQPVFSLVDAGMREVRAGVPAAIADRLNIDDSVWVLVGEKQIEGRLIAKGPVVDQATRSRVVRVWVADDLPPGGLAYLQIAVPNEQRGAWVPDSAVTEGARGTWVVYAVIDSGDNRAHLESRSVVIHHASENTLFVSGALDDGERVVTSGLHRLAPGQLVRPSAGNLFADAYQGH